MKLNKDIKKRELSPSPNPAIPIEP